MLSQLASVFSSQGVVLPGTENVGFPVRGPQAEPPCDHKNNCKCFAPVFDQASAKLELSSKAVKAAEEAGRQEATHKAARENEEPATGEAGGSAETGATGEAAATGEAEASTPGAEELTPEEKKAVEKLKVRDREVRQHEQAHIAAAGGNARGGASYEYQVGPDNRQYAVGGHVDIDVSAVGGNPQATLQKAMTVQRAASAPADPSGADRAVAAAAAGMARDAAKEIADKRGNGSQAAQAGTQVGSQVGSGGKSGEGSAAAEARRNPYARQGVKTGSAVNAYA